MKHIVEKTLAVAILSMVAFAGYSLAQTTSGSDATVSGSDTSTSGSTTITGTSATTGSATAPASAAPTPIQVIPIASTDKATAMKVQLAQQLNAQFNQNLATYKRLVSLQASPSFASLDSTTQGTINTIVASLKTSINTVAPGTITP